ncbi:GntR family transcriptional regulator [Maritalea mediterranea]|uniref:GntR family transcriptional regulator n=1 Tax=Maritalea mediterranea TaxID=2909667 RepID=A0ABS9EBF1_9HYPH|nr:GntR family transcriptional regulator [Maritalea mediterranea]MCF4098776.1 GntR family transcriptional regulator [Maritalea mediterranea]
MNNWNETQPIFVQIRERLTDMIITGSVNEGEALPSVRHIATDLSVNPLTVTKAYQSLVDLGVIEKRRGLGMFVAEGARKELLAHEREAFLKNEWPRIVKQIKALDLDMNELMRHAEK